MDGEEYGEEQTEEKAGAKGHRPRLACFRAHGRARGPRRTLPSSRSHFPEEAAAVAEGGAAAGQHRAG